jgi:xanthine dehydrogenase accessory factor
MEVKLMERLTELIKENTPVALVTVIDKTGSGPRDTGSMMLVDQSGSLLHGTIGGGKVEEQAKEDAKKAIAMGLSSLYHYELTLQSGEHSLGMACGGTVDVFIKTFVVREELLIFGGGHIGLILEQFARMLNYRVTVVDHRPDYVSKERFPLAEGRFLMNQFDSMDSTINENTSIVIITHGHAYDMEALKLVASSPARYIGMIGSKNKITHCLSVLESEGVKKEHLLRVHAPIGLDIGGETPEEIALAILAEIQAVKYNRPGGFLKK